MARLKSKWNQKDRARAPEEIASVVSMNIWQISGDGCLNLENEGFETTTQSQRLDVIAEFVAFTIHMADRMMFDKMSVEERARFINAIGQHTATIMEDNLRDAKGAGDHKTKFIALLNTRMDEFSECNYSETEGPSFTMRRIFGQHVQQVMGEKDKKWIPDYIIDSEVPKLIGSLKRVLAGMDASLQGADFGQPPVPRGAVWGDG